MFDLGWSKLIIIAMLAIVVVGPKDLPALLRTIGKFIGQIRRQAEDFRRQFDEAMKDTELEQIRKDVADIKRTATESVRDLERTAEDTVKPFETATSDVAEMSNGSATTPTLPSQTATEYPPPAGDLAVGHPISTMPAPAPALTKVGA